MDSRRISEWLLKDAERDAERYYGAPYYPFDKDYDLEDLIYELRNRREIPSELRQKIEKITKTKKNNSDNQIILELQRLFGNNISLISLILNTIYPHKYFYYRISKLEREIFTGLKFLSDSMGEFNLPFLKIGRGNNVIGNYLKFNEALHCLSDRQWIFEDFEKIQKRIHYFLYQGVGKLFLERNGYKRYWIMATKKDYFKMLDEEMETIWSGRKEMQKGDLVFMYRQFPRKAITDLYYVSDDSYFDPFGGWDGFWVELKKLTSLKDISMSEMKCDSILKEWNFVKMQSQGTITDPVPNSVFNHLLERIDKNILNDYNITPEPLANAIHSGQFSSEEEFEDKVIEPMLKRWGLKFQRQSPCEFIIGSQSHICQIDFLVRDEIGLITLFENKVRIANEKELSRAVLQAKSYSLQMGISSFIVASPEGFWVYNLNKNKESLLEKLEFSEFEKNSERMKSIISRLRKIG